MLNTMFTLTVLSSVTLQALHASFATPARSFNAQTAFQFLNHGRRKQKKAYKRYIAKLRDEATDDANDLLIARQAGMPYSEKSSSGSRAQAKTRFRARISYCGTPFYGWQLQPGKPTVQGEIEATLTRRFHRRIPVVGAGRTDSGVHARGQAIHFDLFPNELPFEQPQPPTVEGETEAMLSNHQKIKCDKFCEELENSVNRMMSLDIRLFNLQLAPYNWVAVNQSNEDSDYEDCDEDELDVNNAMPQLYARPWHVIQRAESKWYSYRLALGPTLWNPMERFTRAHFIHRPSFDSIKDNGDQYAITKGDIERLQSIIKMYEGTHDFGAFGGQLEQNAKKRNDGKAINTLRTVYKAELVKEANYDFGRNAPNERQHGFIGEEGNWRIDFLLKGALYKMVRNMVGCAIEVWLGRMSEEQLIELLNRSHETQQMRRMDNPCKPAPPEGLTLECVYYDDGF